MENEISRAHLPNVTEQTGSHFFLTKPTIHTQHGIFDNIRRCALDRRIHGHTFPELSLHEVAGRKLRYRAPSAEKPFIMDNAVVVGVGNIYASEALFAAGIDPRREAGSVSKARYAKLTAEIKRIL